MEIGSLCLNPYGYLNPMTAWARGVALGKHEVFFFTELEKGIRKSYGAIELCPASCGRGVTLALPNEPF
jgi:hypothetical protein